jgi:hypothetical protein
MKLPVRLPALCFIGLLLAGSTALGYYYVYVYGPPLEAGQAFMAAMESGSADRVADTVLMSVGPDVDDLRVATAAEIGQLLAGGFERGRILDQRKREGRTRSYHYLVYREPDGQVFALVATPHEGHYRVVIPQDLMSDRRLYLWDYTWTN